MTRKHLWRQHLPFNIEKRSNDINLIEEGNFIASGPSLFPICQIWLLRGSQFMRNLVRKNIGIFFDLGMGTSFDTIPALSAQDLFALPCLLAFTLSLAFALTFALPFALSFAGIWREHILVMKISIFSAFFSKFVCICEIKQKEWLYICMQCVNCILMVTRRNQTYYPSKRCTKRVEKHYDKIIQS